MRRRTSFTNNFPLVKDSAISSVSPGEDRMRKDTLHDDFDFLLPGSAKPGVAVVSFMFRPHARSRRLTCPGCAGGRARVSRRSAPTGLCAGRGPGLSTADPAGGLELLLRARDLYFVGHRGSD